MTFVHSEPVYQMHLSNGFSLVFLTQTAVSNGRRAFTQLTYNPYLV